MMWQSNTQPFAFYKFKGRQFQIVNCQYLINSWSVLQYLESDLSLQVIQLHGSVLGLCTHETTGLH